MNIDGKTRLFGIIGNPVTHSLSPAMHNGAFQSLNKNCAYLPFHVTDIESALQGLRGLSIGGVSVTIPHKETAIPYLDKIDPVAEKIGAINTIKATKQGEKTILHGYNTDWLGAVIPLQEAMQLKGAKIIILGAGGAARAIGFGLLEKGAAIVLCSRTESRGRALAKDLDCDWLPLEQIEALQGDALVNATSVGMAPAIDKSLVPADALTGYKVVMDIVYAPLQTKLLKDAKEAGCLTINGLEMLLYQGVAQFELWTDLDAPVEVMRKILLDRAV